MNEPMMLREQGSIPWSKSVDRKKEKKPKEKRAYIAWEDNDDSTTSSSSQDESEEANLCLMVGYESSSSIQVSSLDLNDYNQLLHDFEELHNDQTIFLHETIDWKA